MIKHCRTMKAVTMLLISAFAASGGKAADRVKVRATPVGSPGMWVTDDDYPVAATLDGVEGTAGFVLNLDADGRVADCKISSSTGSETLDETTCIVLKQRARFNPARDAKNSPIPDTYNGRITWRIPESHALPLANYPQRLKLAFDVNEDGSIESCKVLEKIGEPTFVPKLGRAVDPCDTMTRSKRPSPIIDADGNAIKAHVEILTDTRITPR